MLVSDAKSPAPVLALGDSLPSRNCLLGALPAKELRRLWPMLDVVELDPKAVLFESGCSVTHVHFPETAVISIVSAMENGRVVEVGTVGCEGMAGLPVFLGDDRSSSRAIVQVPGLALRMDAHDFSRAVQSDGPLRRLILRYTEAFLIQLAQTAACNGAHAMEERCARWLLMTHDRVSGDDVPLSLDFLAAMLSVRRTGVTLVMRTLQDEGVIRYARGRVTITDRPRLEVISCECYRVVKGHFDRLLTEQ